MHYIVLSPAVNHLFSLEYETEINWGLGLERMIRNALVAGDISIFLAGCQADMNLHDQIKIPYNMQNN